MTAFHKTLLAGAFGGTLALGAAIGVAVADQPMMHRALENLREARGNLEHATADKGGHRVAAIRDIDAAIREVEEGMRYDRRH